MRLTPVRPALLLALACALARPLCAAAPDFSDPAVEKAVLAANAEMIASANRMDMDAFFGAIVDTDRGMIVQNGTIFATRADARASVERGLRGVRAIDRRFDNPQVTVISPECALLVSAGSVTATLEDGRVMTSRFTVSLVWVRRDGRWQILHGHYSTPPAAM
jgi:ketosteroid isomerase-like protein